VSYCARHPAVSRDMTLRANIRRAPLRANTVRGFMIISD
jgi:hypothetical protein